MGIFSFLINRQRKKTGDPDSRVKEATDTLTLDTRPQASVRSSAQQRDQARQTRLKIDAIELEMTQALLNPPRSGSAPLTMGQDAPGAEALAPKTDFLFTQHVSGDSLSMLQAEATPALEEAAILYSRNQEALAEQRLLAGLEQSCENEALRGLYWALFDLYRLAARETDFEALALSYAARLETSPPSWDKRWNEAYERTHHFPKALPTVSLTGALTEQISRTLERLDKLAQDHAVVRLDCAAVTAINAPACALLLQSLQNVQARARDVLLLEGERLLPLLRKRVNTEPGHEAGWLLLLEVLRLLGKEAEFEALSLEYCVRFEVSPPSFFAPNVAQLALPPGYFLMPAIIEESPVGLINAIMAAAEQQDTVVLDCTRLQRIEFTAAGQLLYGLTPLSEYGKAIRFENINHLSAELLQVLGFAIIARILPFRY